MFEKHLKKNRIPRQHCRYAVIALIAWFVVMYGLGYFLKVSHDRAGTVPKILHKTAKGLFPGTIQTSFYRECESMYLDDGWEVKLWLDDDIDLFVAEFYPQYFKQFKEIHPHIKQVDAVRYLFMHHYGGIYLDMDAECIRPAGAFIDGLVKGSTAWMGGYPEPFFLMSTRGNDFWIFAFELILRDWKKYNVRSTAGPQGLNRMAKAYAYTFGRDSIRPFIMYDSEECDRIEPNGDVVCGEPTYRWVESRDQFPPSKMPVYDKIGFIPNAIVDPTACLSRIGNCKMTHCHDRMDVQPFLFVHHCLFGWRDQAKA